MTWAVSLTPRARRELRGLDPATQDRILARLSRLASEGPRAFERLRGVPECKLRVGDYRCVADIDAAARAINITHIGHRKNIYDA